MIICSRAAAREPPCVVGTGDGRRDSRSEEVVMKSNVEFSGGRTFMKHSQGEGMKPLPHGGCTNAISLFVQNALHNGRLNFVLRVICSLTLLLACISPSMT